MEEVRKTPPTLEEILSAYAATGLIPSPGRWRSATHACPLGALARQTGAAFACGWAVAQFGGAAVDAFTSGFDGLDWGECAEYGSADNDWPRDFFDAGVAARVVLPKEGDNESVQSS